MKRKEKNELLKKMADALDAVLEATGDLPKEQAAEIVGLLRECDAQMPHFVNKDKPRRYSRLLAEGKLNLDLEVVR
jgi:hypothetical protein